MFDILYSISDVFQSAVCRSTKSASVSDKVRKRPHHNYYFPDSQLYGHIYTFHSAKEKCNLSAGRLRSSPQNGSFVHFSHIKAYLCGSDYILWGPEPT